MLSGLGDLGLGSIGVEEETGGGLAAMWRWGSFSLRDVSR